MRLRGALECVDRQVEQCLNDVGAIHPHADFFRQRVNCKLMVVTAGMDLDQMIEICQQLIDAYPRGFIGLPSQETEITPRNLDAISDLPGDGLQPVFDEIQIIGAQPGRVTDALVHKLNEAGDDGQGTIDIMDDAGVNLAARMRHLLLHFLFLQLDEQFLEFFCVGVDFAFEGASLHCRRHRSPHGGQIEWLVYVIAGTQAKGLAYGVGGLESSHHHYFDGRVHVFQSFQDIDAGHARHANIQHGDINSIILGE